MRLASLFLIIAMAGLLPDPAAEAQEGGPTGGLAKLLKTTSSPRTAPHSPKDEKCQAAYRKIFGKPVVDIRVVFGYKDTRPARFVGDRHERLAFVQRILQPCEPGIFACGFTRSEESADLFTREIDGFDGRKVEVQLSIVHSSVASDDAANRADPFQTWQGTHAREIFFNGLAKADVVFYNGHSRFGGGPDFAPPRLTRGGEVDSTFYRAKRPGFSKALEKLRLPAKKKKSAGGSLKILGLFSCASSQHFANEIGSNAAVGLISSRGLIYYADALDNSLAALSALLEMRCQSDFKSAIRNDVPARSSQLTGFFPK